MIFMALGQKDIRIWVHMWLQLKGHLRVIWGHWPKMVKICTIGQCIHVIWWIFMGLGQNNIGVWGTHVTPTTSWTQWSIMSFDGDTFYALHNPKLILFVLLVSLKMLITVLGQLSESVFIDMHKKSVNVHCVSMSCAALWLWSPLQHLLLLNGLFAKCSVVQAWPALQQC